MKQIILTAIAALVTASSFSGCAAAFTVAVKRGQQTVDPKLLPLACLSLTTEDIALPLDTVVVEDLSTHAELWAHVGTNDPTHPDILTALEGDHRSLSLVILHLNPGQYRLKKLEYLGARNSYFDFDLKEAYHLVFTVQPGCVNYIGGLAIGADWRSIRMPAPSLKGVAEASFRTSVTIEHTAKRDAKWAVDVIPGMASLPATESPLQNQ